MLLDFNSIPRHQPMSSSANARLSRPNARGPLDKTTPRANFDLPHAVALINVKHAKVSPNKVALRGDLDIRATLEP